MFVHNLKQGIVMLVAALLLPSVGCAPTEKTQVEEGKEMLITTLRPLPFLAGQAMGVTQGTQVAGDGHTIGGDIQYGVDFSFMLDHGLPVVAVNDGYVSWIDTGNKDSFAGDECPHKWGNTVVYCGSYGVQPCERAGHLREVFVKPGEFVRQGQVIGLLGTSGKSTGHHLHAQQQAGTSNGTSLAAQYRYVQSLNGAEQTSSFYRTVQVGTQDQPFLISNNIGIMGVKSAQYSSDQIGQPISPRTVGLYANDGWRGYGWYGKYEECVDNDGDSDVLCDNEGSYRTNTYIRRFSGGSFGSSVIVYDALNGATQSYLVHSGFLSNTANGWDLRGTTTTPQNNFELGMPISDEYTTSYGARQDFQWGWLKWDSANSMLTRRKYPIEVNSKRSIGPGVFAPNNTTAVHFWNRQASYRFVDAWNLHAGFNGVGEPYSDNNANAGVHVWPGTRFLVQNFTNPTYGESIIMYDPENGQYADLMLAPGNVPAEGWNKAYLLRGGFWNWYRYNNGIGQLKAPISDEYVTSYGTRQDFLCGSLRLNTSTSTITPYIDTTLATCNISVPTPPTGGCYVAGPSVPDGNSTGGAGSSKMIIDCRVGPTDTTVFVTGPIQGGVFSTMYQDDVFVEYGSDTDGWAPYTSGKPKNTWMGDWITSEVPRTYMFTLGANVQNMNFFMYQPSTGAVSWFDLDKWAITGDCWRDGGGIRHYVPPTATKTLACAVNGPDMTVTLTGPINQGIFGNPPSDNPTYIEYGSDTDGWGPYTTGKPKATWMSNFSNHTLIVSSSVQNFNFFMYGPSSGQVSWFDLNQWNITGDCWRDQGGIRHSMPPTTPKYIDCQVSGPDMTVTLTGPINQGIFGTPPTDNPTYIEYGSDSDGWGPYTTGKPKATWFNWLNAHTFILSASVQNMNFFMYGPTSGQVSWFDLNQWTITGRCWRDGGGIRHN